MRSSICIRAATHPKGEVRKNYYNDLGGFNTALFRTRLDEITKLLISKYRIIWRINTWKSLGINT